MTERTAKWTTLRHQGVAFPPEYEYRGLTVKIKGQPHKLDALQEEMLMAWAKKKDTPYVNDRKFQENFVADLIEAGKLPAGTKLDEIDWTELHAIADREKTANLSDEEKKKRSAERKAVREELKARFGTALIDEQETEIGAYLVEPPGILMGRGEHPLRGKWKRRIEPEDVILNLDEEAPVPEAPEGHHWKEIVHKHDAMWVASWWDDLSKKTKYVWLADSSHLRQERDKEKYVKAQRLEAGLDKVRAQIRKGMAFRDDRALRTVEKKSAQLDAEKAALNAKLLKPAAAQDGEARKQVEEALAKVGREIETVASQRQRLHDLGVKKRQIATVCYLIDKLAMRVGDEKDEDEADTVGASTLRCEHVKVLGDKIEFDFLGKDSVQWQKFLPLNAEELILASNLKEFMHGKEPGEQIFHQIGSTHVNQFLSSIVPGLTAKVFRTYHATTTVRSCLKENGNLGKDAPSFEKEYTAKLANLEAAITCNHKRTPPKNWEQNLAKKEEAVEKLRAAKPDVKKLRAQIGEKQAALEKLLKEQKALEAEPPKDADKKGQRLTERIAKAREALEKAQAAPDKAERDYRERVARAERQLQLAKATRDYNLGTSLKNYIDPRVYKAWGDYVDFEWKRLYTKALQRKFTWVNQSRVKWNPAAGANVPEEESDLENGDEQNEPEAVQE